MSCGVSLLRPGLRTEEHRHTSSTVYHVIEGDGVSVVDGKTLAWTKGDTFVVPTWAWHRHANTSSTADAVLFNFSDLPLMQKIGLYREQSR